MGNRVKSFFEVKIYNISASTRLLINRPIVKESCGLSLAASNQQIAYTSLLELPYTRRAVASTKEKSQQLSDPHHPLFSYTNSQQQDDYSLSKSFMGTVDPWATQSSVKAGGHNTYTDRPLNTQAVRRQNLPHKCSTFRPLNAVTGRSRHGLPSLPPIFTLLRPSVLDLG